VGDKIGNVMENGKKWIIKKKSVVRVCRMCVIISSFYSEQRMHVPHSSLHFVLMMNEIGRKNKKKIIRETEMTESE